MSALRLLLNSDFTGANAFFALADADGSLRSAGLDLHFTLGRGAWTAAARLADGEFDLAYGDINALAERVALQGVDELPQAVCMLHQHAPSAITVARSSAIHEAADLRGKHIVGHATDVALKTFPLFARANGLAMEAVKTSTASGTMRTLLQAMLEGQSDAVFGYLTTHTAALADAGLRASDSVRFLPYRKACPALYGSALMASARMLREQPQQVWRLVQVLRASIAAAQAQPERALDAVMARAPTATRATEAERLQGTLAGDMGLNAAPGERWGDVDDQRLTTGMSGLALACGWPSVPLAHRVFTRRFLAAQLPEASAAR